MVSLNTKPATKEGRKPIPRAKKFAVCSLIASLVGCQDPGRQEDVSDIIPLDTAEQDELGRSLRGYATVSTDPEAPFPNLDEKINFSDIDSDRLHSAILLETNRARAREGLPPLSSNPLLILAAKHHAQDMVDHDFFSHESPVEGRKDLLDRCRTAGREWGGFGENIAISFGIALESGEPFLPPSAENSYFARAGTLAPIVPRSYTELARAVVRDWMNSPGHRANILKGSWTHLGSAAALYLDRSSFDMPKFKIVQVFGSRVGLDIPNK
jgi:uncharacterized protein YkwD